MHDHDMNVTQMMWQPALLRFTAVPHPDMTEQGPHYVYIAAHLITGAERRPFRWSKLDSKEEQWPTQVGTSIMLASGGGYWVEELPETIALMRDKALGHEPKIGAVK